MELLNRNRTSWVSEQFGNQNTRLKQDPVVFSYCRVRIHSVQPGLAVPAQWSRYEDLWLDK
jgi:hypothetical protein